MTGQTKKKTSKAPKGNQPKRKRYIAANRMVTNAIRNLERHMKKYSRDGQDKPAVAVLEQLRGGQRGNRT